MSRTRSGQIVQADLAACAPYVRACEIAAMFHLLQKMASNKVQSELGGRMVSCSRRTPRNQTTTDSIPVTAICCAAAASSNALYPLPAILFANLEFSASSYEGKATKTSTFERDPTMGGLPSNGSTCVSLIIG